MTNYAVTIGNFDGVHLGHAQFIANAKNEAQKRGLKLMVVTFDPHPANFFKGEGTFLLTRISERIDILNSFGADHVEVIHFDAKIAALSGEDFLDKLNDKFKISMFFCGHDFSIGRSKSFQKKELIEYCHQRSIELVESEIYYQDGIRTSSSQIRELLVNGKVDEARSLLGRSFYYKSVIIKGKQMGRKIGFPTANMEIPADKIKVKRGVYKTKSIINDREYLSVTNIGIRPTIDNDNKEVVETHIIDFEDVDLYGKEIKVSFMSYIREEIEFSNIDQLVEQIKSDVLKVKRSES